MATATKCLYRQALSISHRTQWLSYRQWQTLNTSKPQQTSYRSFTSTPFRAADSASDSQAETSDSAPYFNRDFFNSLDRNDRAEYRTMSYEERRQMETVKQALDEEFSDGSRTDRDLSGMADIYAQEVENEFPEPPSERLPPNYGYVQMGEREDIGPDDEYGEDDITSIAHRELEQHREIREYTRLAAWEMPLLANLAIPFTPPTASTPLRFRYTSYMGEPHPASRKVVVEFTPSDLSLTQPQARKLIKLAGARYNPSSRIVKMSCESFETQAQNKRYLGDTINSLIAESKNEEDMFEDVPFDFRHKKSKPRYRFPEQWLLTEDRKRELEERRRAMELEEGEKRDDGKLVSGIEAIEEGRRIDLERVEAPIMAEAKAGLPKGKMGKKQMGQKGR